MCAVMMIDDFIKVINIVPRVKATRFTRQRYRSSFIFVKEVNRNALKKKKRSARTILQGNGIARVPQ